MNDKDRGGQACVDTTGMQKNNNRLIIALKEKEAENAFLEKENEFLKEMLKRMIAV